MRILFFTFCFLITANRLIAQEVYTLGTKNGDETITMTVVNKSPDNTSKFYAGVDLGIAFSSFSFYPGISLAYFHSPTLHINSNTILPFDLLAAGKSLNKENFEKAKHLTQSEIVATWFFINREKLKRKQLYFGSSMNRNYFTKIEIPKSVKLGLRGGYNYSILPIRTFLDNSDYSKNNFPQIYQSHNLVVGLSSTKGYQYIVNTDDFGTKGQQIVNQIYLDAIILMSGTTFYPPEFPNSPAEFIQKNSKAGKAGWKFGWSTTRGHSPSGMGVKYSLEFGSMPGTIKKGAGGFFNFKIGFGYFPENKG